jgi:hypothetical protein
MKIIWAPWRIEYITKEKENPKKKRIEKTLYSIEVRAVLSY